MNGDSCQAVLHGCLPAENAAIYFAALQHTGTNPLRNAIFALPQPVLLPHKKEKGRLDPAKGANPWLA
jgi:hypothetical protein